MTRARNTQISITDTPYYHCVSRCVRRAFLCGKDDHTGKSYSHRKQWIIQRLEQISLVYSIDICAYAIMENHYHLVLKVDDTAAQSLTDKEVREKWMQLYHGDVLINRFLNGDCHSQAELEKVNEITQQWRLRLSDLSWFMRSLNEYIARKANEEDNCKGHFWESRFKSQALLNEQALLSCMAYVDLNPIRAGINETLEDSDFTSIQQRISDVGANGQCLVDKGEEVAQDKDEKRLPLAHFVGGQQLEGIPFRLIDYLELADWTGRAVRDDKRGFIPVQAPKLLEKLGIDAELWLENVRQYHQTHKSFVGTEVQLKKICEQTGKKWLSGMKQSRLLYHQLNSGHSLQ